MRHIDAQELLEHPETVLAELARSGDPVAIYREGRVIATLAPPSHEPAEHPQRELVRTVREYGELRLPVWETVVDGERTQQARSAATRGKSREALIEAAERYFEEVEREVGPPSRRGVQWAEEVAKRNSGQKRDG